MIIDIIQTITNFLKLRNQITITQICSYTYEHTYIYSLDISNMNIDNIYKKIIMQHKFNELEKLDCSGNSCSVDQNCIYELKKITQ